MKTLALTLAAAGLMAFGTTSAEAGGFHGGYVGIGFGGYSRPYAGGFYGNPGCGYRRPVWHDTSHYHVVPPTVIPHGNHFHVQPGGVYLHQTGHWHY